ncbi:MAG: hypothetical protein KBD76_10435 [Bacteriovorax sp.]|nr:hypothetical protein [Bacteriovorax sp.]
MTNIKFSFLVIGLMTSFQSWGSIAPLKEAAVTHSQMIHLNLQFKAKHKTVKSDLAMPFYQTAEIERTVDNKNVLIEVNPRRGKNSNEVTIEMRFFKAAGFPAYAKKEIIAKLGEESKISVKGLTVRVTPVVN